MTLPPLRYLAAVFLSCAACHSAFAQAAANLNGIYPVSEIWSVTMYIGTDVKTYTGTETGMLTVTNGTYSQINHTVAPSLAGIGTKRTINYNGSSYGVAGAVPFTGEIGEPGATSYAVIQLNYFVVEVPIPSDGGFSGVESAYWSSNFSATGATLASLSGSGVFVDASGSTTIPGYIWKATDSSISWMGAAVVPAQLQGPTNGSAITSSPVTFTWNAGSGASAYALWVGSKPNGTDIYDAVETGLSQAVTVPTDGRTIYVTPWSKIDGIWVYGTPFSYNLIAITTSAAPVAGGTTAGDGSIGKNSGALVTATANSGYDFVNWTVGGAEVSENPSYAVYATASEALVANFVLTTSDNYLASLVPSTGALTPAFAKITTNYASTVAKSALNYTVTPTALATSGATVTVSSPNLNGGTPVTVASGSACPNIPLSTGANPPISIVVTALDKTTKTYTITVTKSGVTAASDVNGDGKSDLVFQNGSGQVYSWFLDGTGNAINGTQGLAAGSKYLYSAGLGDWRVVGVADVNGDGIPDLVFQNGAGQVYAWFLDGTGNAVNGTQGIKGSGYLCSGSLGDWRVMAVADVNGDGTPDLVFQNGAGQIYVWFLDGTGNVVDGSGQGIITSGYLFTGGLGDWRVAAVADVNGDGTPDIVFQNTAGQIYAWFLDGTGNTVDGTGQGVKSSGYLFTGGLGDWRVMAVTDVSGDGIPDIVFQNTLGQVYSWFLDGSGNAVNGSSGLVPGSKFLFTGGLGDWRIR
jgi:hypothetical protein